MTAFAQPEGTLRMHIYRMLSLLLLLTAGCGRGQTAAPAQPEPMAPFPSPVRLYYDNSGGIADSVRVVVKDAAEFQRVWQQATARQSSPPGAPAIDFASEMVVLVGAGRMTPEDRIAVDSVGVTRPMNAAGRMEETLTIFVRTTLACERFDIAAYPLEILRLRRFDGPVRFQESSGQAQNCRSVPLP